MPGTCTVHVHDVQSLPVCHSLPVYRTLISHFLSSVRNTHAQVPRDKMEFILAIIDGPVPLLHSPGVCVCVCVCTFLCVCDMCAHRDPTVPPPHLCEAPG